MRQEFQVRALLTIVALTLAVGCQPGWEEVNEKAKAAARSGDAATAEASFRKAIELADATGTREQQIMSRNNLAEVLRVNDRLNDALPYYREALELRAEEVEPGARLAQSYSNLADHYRVAGQFDEALEFYGKGIEIAEQIPEGEPNPLPDLLNDSGVLFLMKGDHDGAIEAYERAISLAESAEDQTSRQSLPIARGNLGQAYLAKRDLEQAEAAFRASLRDLSMLEGVSTARFGLSQANLAEVLARREKYDEAEPLFLEAIDRLQGSMPETRSEIADVWNNLALMYRSQERYDEALPYLEQALERLTATRGESHPDTAATWFNLGRLAEASGKNGAAIDAYGNSHRIYSETFGSDARETNLARDRLAATLTAAGREDEAAALAGD